MRRFVTAACIALLAMGCSSNAARTGTLNMGNAHIHYMVAGRGRAVVLIHGWALDLRYWDDQIAALSPHYRVVALDRRGYGQSTGYADPTADPGDVAALLDTLGIRSAVLIGHSGGADVAIRFAAKLPARVDALVLYGGGMPDSLPAPLSSGLGGIDLRGIARQYGVDSVFRFLRSLPMFRSGPHRTPAMQARVDSITSDYRARKDLLDVHPESGAFPPAQFAVMREWKFPTLFISGESERPPWIEFADSMVKWMPDARMVLIPGGAHGVSADEPARFNSALLAFLADVDRGR